MNLKQMYNVIDLVWQLLRRDLQERHAGMWLGMGWLILQPLFLLVLYSLVFGEILQLRFNSLAQTEDTSSLAFAHYLFAGLLLFNAFAEILTRAPSCITDRRDLLLNTPLPITVLPLLPVASSILFEWINIALLSVALLLVGAWHWQILIVYWPVFLVRLLLSLAASYSLAILGVFLRDLKQIMPAVLTVLLFLSPVLYPLELIPAQYQPLYEWNLIGQLVQAYRSALLEGQLVAIPIRALLVISLALCLAALALYQRLLPRVRHAL